MASGFLPFQFNLAVIPLPQFPLKNTDPRILGGLGRRPHLTTPFSSSPNWFSRQGRKEWLIYGGAELRVCHTN